MQNNNNYLLKMNMIKGFTLAEILITIGIIGIIASLTIPQLIQNAQDKELRTLWKKKYSELNQIVNQIYAEEGVRMRQSVSSWEHMPRYFCKIQKKMKFEKSGINCPEDEDTIPADSSLWPASGVTYWHLNGGWFKKDGTQAGINLGYRYLSAKMIDGTTVLYYCGNTLLIDVNGEKKPNIIGRDIYGFGIQSDTNKTYFPGTSTTEYWPGCMANAYDSYVNEGTYKEDCENGSGWGCSALYLAE